MGTNTLTLSGTNTYTGGTTVANGGLTLGSAAALPGGTILTLGPLASNAAGTVTLSVATSVSGLNIPDSNALATNFSGAWTIAGPGTLTIGAGGIATAVANTDSNRTWLSNAVQINAPVTLGASQTWTAASGTNPAGAPIACVAVHNALNLNGNTLTIAGGGYLSLYSTATGTSLMTGTGNSAVVINGGSVMSDYDGNGGSYIGIIYPSIPFTVNAGNLWSYYAGPGFGGNITINAGGTFSAGRCNTGSIKSTTSFAVNGGVLAPISDTWYQNVTESFGAVTVGGGESVYEVYSAYPTAANTDKATCSAFNLGTSHGAVVFYGNGLQLGSVAGTGSNNVDRNHLRRHPRDVRRQHLGQHHHAEHANHSLGHRLDERDMGQQLCHLRRHQRRHHRRAHADHRQLRHGCEHDRPRQRGQQLPLGHRGPHPVHHESRRQRDLQFLAHRRHRPGGGKQLHPRRQRRRDFVDHRQRRLGVRSGSRSALRPRPPPTRPPSTRWAAVNFGALATSEAYITVAADLSRPTRGSVATYTGGTLSINASLNATALTKSGPGMLVLDGPVTLSSGIVTVDNGTIQLAPGITLPSNAVVNLYGSTAGIAANGYVTGIPITNGSTTPAQNGTLDLNGNSQTVAGLGG